MEIKHLLEEYVEKKIDRIYENLKMAKEQYIGDKI